MRYTPLAFTAVALLGSFSSAQAKRQLQNREEHLTTVVETHTYTATRVEQTTTDVPPYITDTTILVTWTAVQTQTVY
ncbi:hypothetical protein BD413DRAFT_613859 [Trametes elegans]|nr:hypothetical protein BD413DRAFT_613859 [Trametes elegans]